MNELCNITEGIWAEVLNGVFLLHDAVDENVVITTAIYPELSDDNATAHATQEPNEEVL